MMAGEFLPKSSPKKYQRLVMINTTYHIKYSVRNSLDKPKHIQQPIFKCIQPDKIKGLS